MNHPVFDELEDDKTHLVISFHDSMWTVELWEDVPSDFGNIRIPQPIGSGVDHDLEKAMDACYSDYLKAAAS